MNDKNIFFVWIFAHCYGFRVDQSEYDAFIKTLNNGDEFEILVSRDNILKTYTIKMGGKNSKKYSVKTNFTDETRRNFDFWLRVDITQH